MNTVATESLVLDQIALCEQQLKTLEVDHQKLVDLHTQAQTTEIKVALIDPVKVLGTKIQTLKRIYSTLQAGYGEITIPERKGWTNGYPKEQDFRPYKWMHWFTPIVILEILLVFVCGGLHITAIVLWPPMTIYFTLLFYGSIGIFATTGIIRAYLEALNRSALREANLPYYGTVRFLKEALPLEVQERYQKAKQSGLFETIQVFAPLPSFSKVALKVDPIMYGTVGHRTFLIAQWNLGEDLK